MTQLEKVLYTAKTHTTSFRSGRPLGPGAFANV